MGAVVRAARERDLHMAVVREDGLVHALGEGCRVIAAEGAQPLARAGDDVSRAGCEVAISRVFLVDMRILDDSLELLIHLRHVLKLDAGDLDALPVRQEDLAVAELLGNLHDPRHALCRDEAARDADTACRLAADLAVAEGILLERLDIHVLNHAFPPNPACPWTRCS